MDLQLPLVLLLKHANMLYHALQIINLRIGLSLHEVKGSPMYPSMQVQIGI